MLGIGFGRKFAEAQKFDSVGKDAHVKKADTIADLARAIKVPAEELEATIKRWNEDIRAGKDTLFGRPVKKAAKSYAFDAPLVSAPLEKGPYYALELWPTLVNTQGGPRRDQKARIVSALGKTVRSIRAPATTLKPWSSGASPAATPPTKSPGAEKRV